MVYKGVRTKTDGDWEQVAIKKVKDTDTMPSSAVDDMEREVNLMKKLSHENIVKIRGVLQDGPNVIIVMEYIREGSLDRCLPPSSILNPRSSNLHPPASSILQVPAGQQAQC